MLGDFARANVAMTEEPSSEPSANRYLTGQRKDLHAWMNWHAPPLADLYLGALELLYGSILPGRSRFIAHAVREIANRLPDALGGQKQGRYDPFHDLDNIVRAWNAAPFSQSIMAGSSAPEANPAATPRHIPMPHSLYRELEKLVQKWQTSRQTAPQRMRGLFLALVPEHRAAPELLEPAVQQWGETVRYFQSIAHENLQQTVDVDELVRRFELFEHSLFTLVGSFYKGLDVLDEILGKANS